MKLSGTIKSAKVRFKLTIGLLSDAVCIVLGASISIGISAAEANEGPSLKQRQLCELHVTQGYLALAKQNTQQNSTAQAESLFNKGMSVWPECYLAAEGLAIIKEKKNDLRGALEALLAVKRISPDERWPHLNYHIGRLYLELKAEERAEIYLKVAQNQGVFPVQVRYLLGYLAYRRGLFLIAEDYFQQALVLAEESQDAEDRALRQTLNAYLAECYARLGYPKDAVIRARAAEAGDHTEPRKGAWRIHATQNRWLKEYGFGVFHFYDGNAARFSAGQSVAGDLSNKSSHGINVVWDGRIESPPTKNFGGGAEGVVSWAFNMAESLDRFDELKIMPRAWARYSDLQHYELRAGYEFSSAGFGRYTYSSYEIAHGPWLAGEMLTLHRWALSAQYRFNIKSYPQDTGPLWVGEDDRDGLFQELRISLAAKGPNPGLRPKLSYRLAYNSADGKNFTYLGHGMDAFVRLRLPARSELFSGMSLDLRSYGQSLVERSDKVLALRIGANSALFDRFLVSLDLTYEKLFSNINPFRYDRFAVHTGVLFRFD